MENNMVEQRQTEDWRRAKQNRKKEKGSEKNKERQRRREE